MKLFCGMCKQEKKEEEFTKFSRNPALKDRNGRVSICRDCCIDYVDENENSKEALKGILRLIDLPYIEKYANSALNSLDKKRKNTNIITKKNAYSGDEIEERTEGVKIQNSIYTCYSSNLGVMPKIYFNFSHSDGIRDEASFEKEVERAKNDKENISDKVIKSAFNFLKKFFQEDVINDTEMFPKVLKNKLEELSLYKNNTTNRQNKYKLKNHVIALIDNGKFEKSNFSFLFDEVVEEKKGSTNEEDSSQGQAEQFVIPDNLDMNEMKTKWGSEFKAKDIVKFENKYRELIKNYEIKTAAHNEFLRLACIASVRGQECMATNNVDGAKQWMGMFKDLTSAGKLQPSQMSKADLSGGLNNFSEFFKTVEQAKNIVSILPEMYETPRDKADFVIFCLVQYVRRLKGLPDVEYKDIYKFYDEMASQFIDESDENIDFESFFDNEDDDNGSE